MSWEKLFGRAVSVPMTDPKPGPGDLAQKKAEALDRLRRHRDGEAVYGSPIDMKKINFDSQLSSDPIVPRARTQDDEDEDALKGNVDSINKLKKVREMLLRRAAPGDKVEIIDGDVVVIPAE